jgi:RNA polymerase sigma-70 factor (ECF subfamily)
MNNKLNDDENKLIAEAQRGDIKAFERLIMMYQKKIYATAYYILMDRDEAEDVVQSVFITIWQSIKKLKSASKFKTWLYRMTVNKSIDLIRKRKKIVAEGVESRQVDYEEKVMYKYDIEKIFNELIKKLPEQQKLALILKDVHGLEMKEVAEIMKINESTVRSHLSLARQALQEEINRRYPEYGKGKDKE